MDEKRKTLVILERSNGFYGGYEKSENSARDYTQVFNASSENLFRSILEYYESGYAIKFLGREKEEEFMKNRKSIF